MKRWASIVLAACVLTSGCGDDNPSSPSSGPMVFVAELFPANEVPPIGNVEGGGRGNVQITIDGGAATFFFQLTAFPSDTRVVGAHIHTGGPGVNGPIIVNTGISAASPVVLSNPITEFTSARITVDAATLQAIVNNPLGHYFNVHSPLNPGGFARGQLVRIQ
jgi:hypothetical protein